MKQALIFLAAAITRGNITLENVNPQHIQVLLSKLTETNFRLSIGLNKITLESGRIIQPANIITLTLSWFCHRSAASIYELSNFGKR